MDYASILARYIGREVYVSTFGHVRLRGELAAVYEDCVRLINASSSQETEESPWSKSLAETTDHMTEGAASEALVHFHHIVAIRCADEELMDVPVLPEFHTDVISEASPAETVPHLDPPQESWDSFLEVDRLTLEVGSQLVSLVHPENTDIMQRVAAIRCHLADALGVVVPRLRLRDTLELGDQEYRILIDQCEVARGRLGPGQHIALDMGNSTATLQGVRGIDPTFGGPGIWISGDRRLEAEKLGYLVIDPVMLIVTHLQETLRRHAHEMLSISDVRELLERLRDRSPGEFEEIRSGALSASMLHAVLRRILEEGESIKNFTRIVEVLALQGHRTQDIESLVAMVRVRLGRQLIQRYLDPEGKVHAIGLERDLEAPLLKLTDEEAGHRARGWMERLVDVLRETHQQMEEQQRPVALVVSSPLRTRLWEMLASQLPQLSVLSLAEVPRGTEIFWEMRISSDDVGAPEPVPMRAVLPVSKEGTYRPPGKLAEHIAEELPPRRPR